MPQTTMFQNQPWYVAERVVAAMTGLSLSKLRQDRHFCRGIPYCKVGRAIRYDIKDVVCFMESHRISHNPE